MLSPKRRSIFDEIYQYVCGLTIIDTHEHLPPFSHKRSQNDVIQEFLIHYLSCDIISGHTPREQFNRAVQNAENLPLEQRWKILEQGWEFARYTGYGRSVAIAARDIYGIEKIDADSIAELNRRFIAARSDETHYKRVLKEMCSIEYSVLDAYVEEADSEFFRTATQIGFFLNWEYDKNAQHYQPSAARNIGSCPENLEDYLAKMKKYYKKMLHEKGSVCIKSANAYERSIRYDKPDMKTAAGEYAALLAAPKALNASGQVCGPKIDKTNFENAVMHATLEFLNEIGGVIQIHTGLQEGNGNDLSNSHPMKLNNLFGMYPNVKFDLFHIGYPYQGVVSALSKNFPNVYIDMCWAHIISPVAARNALIEFLDAVPYSKISAFGGDYCFVDGVYGHLVIARENIALALSEKVAMDIFDIDAAKHIAKRLLYDNPKSLFG